MDMGVVSTWLKPPGREADHSQSSTAEAKNLGSIPPLLHTHS
jgi:hypothetical protein